MDSTGNLTADINLVDLLNNSDNRNDHIVNPLQLMQINNTYYDTETISGELNVNHYKLKVIHFNIRSLPDKFDQLKILLTNTNINPDIILLCETFLNTNNETLYQLPDYQFISACRKNKTCGGVGMYIHNNIVYKLRPDLAPHNEGSFETIFIEVLNSDKRYIIGEVYRPPNAHLQTSINNYEETLMNINQTKLESIIGTDQNLDYMKINEHKKTQDLLHIFFNNGYLPTIIKPTRITHNTSTLIDNLYLKTSGNTLITSGIITTDISDHLPILICIKSTKPKKKQ